jgi:hypothetical protein
LQDLIEKGEKQPNLTIGILVSVVVVIFSILLKVIFGGKKNVSIVPLSFGHFVFCPRQPAFTEIP